MFAAIIFFTLVALAASFVVAIFLETTNYECYRQPKWLNKIVTIVTFPALVVATAVVVAGLWVTGSTPTYGWADLADDLAFMWSSGL